MPLNMLYFLSFSLPLKKLGIFFCSSNIHLVDLAEEELTILKIVTLLISVLTKPFIIQGLFL